MIAPRLCSLWILRAGLIACVLVRGAGSARAQIIEEPKAPLVDPSKFARGLYADAELGSVFFLGAAYRPLGFGTALGARVGYDFVRWASVQAHFLGSTHEIDFGVAPQTGEILQLFQGSAELKLGVSFGQFGVAATGGAGLGYFSSNLLSTSRLDVQQQTSLLFVGGLSVDYHTLSRHFSFGLCGSFIKLTELDVPGGINATVYARYTF